MPKKDSSKILISFLDSSPTGQPDRKLIEEFKDLAEALDRELPGRFDVRFRWNESATILPALVDDYQPQLVHFSGHGHGNESGLVFVDEKGDSYVPNPAAVAKVFEQVRDRVRCVVLNACYSENQAVRIAEYVDVVIGVSGSIADSDMRTFSRTFYLELGSGRSVGQAFKIAKLKLSFGNDAAQHFLIILARENVNPDQVVLGGKQITSIDSLYSKKDIDRLDGLIELMRFPPRGATPEETANRKDEVNAIFRRLIGVPAPRRGAIVVGVQLQEEIGAGEFATVWRGVDVKSRQDCAVKMHRSERLAIEGSVHYFRKGVRAMKLLSETDGCPANIVRALVIDESELAFSMKFFEGGSLLQMPKGAWRTGHKLEIFRSICGAVHFAHGAGVLHRDIRPPNILLDKSGYAHLADFDIAELLNQRTRTTTAPGSDVYAAPEQRRGLPSQKAPTADIYSLGCVLLYLMLERDPSDDLSSDVEAIEDEKTANVVRKCTKPNPADRYQSVRDLVRSFDEGWAGATELGDISDYSAASVNRAQKQFDEARSIHDEGNIDGAISALDQAIETLGERDLKLRGMLMAERDKWSAKLGDSGALKRHAFRWFWDGMSRRPWLTALLVIAGLAVIVFGFYVKSAIEASAKGFYGDAQGPEARGKSTDKGILSPELQPVTPSESGESSDTGDIDGQPDLGKRDSSTEMAIVTFDDVMSGLLAKHGKKWPQYVPESERVAYLEAELRGRRDVTDVDFSRTDAVNWTPSITSLALRGVILDASAFDDAKLPEAVFFGASMRGINMKRGNFRKANFARANLSELEIVTDGQVTRIPSNLFGADLRDTLFAETDLRGARLIEADFSGADFSGAAMLNAWVRGANFSTAIITVEQICSTLGWADAVLPGEQESQEDRTSNFRKRANATCKRK